MSHLTLLDKKDDTARTWCELRGVSRGVLYGKYLTDWRVYLQSYQFKGRDVTIKRQWQWFRQMDADVFQPTFTAIVGMNQVMIEQIAFYLFLTAYYQSDPLTKMPYWHAVTGGKTDVLRDNDHGSRSLLGAPINFLVVSNVSAGASFAKTEKVRDVLSQFDYLPRLLVVNDGHPTKYFDSQLYMTPSRILFVDDRACL